MSTIFAENSMGGIILHRWKLSVRWIIWVWWYGWSRVHINNAIYVCKWMMKMHLQQR